jgi:hypothetical protein
LGILGKIGMQSVDLDDEQKIIKDFTELSELALNKI